MSLPGPFLAGQRLTAGQLNDATQKTLKSIDIIAAGALYTTSGTTELDLPKFALSAIPQVNGGLYRFDLRIITSQNTLATDQFSLFIRRDTALTGTIIDEIPIYPPPTVNGVLLVVWADFPAVADESVNYFLSAKRRSGTGTFTVYGQLLTSSHSAIKISRVGYSSEFALVA